MQHLCPMVYQQLADLYKIAPHSVLHKATQSVSGPSHPYAKGCHGTPGNKRSIRANTLQLAHLQGRALEPIGDIDIRPLLQQPLCDFVAALAGSQVPAHANPTPI